jgi:hypothetical protein
MKTLKEFTIWIPTEFGVGCFTLKAKDFTDAFLRLGKKDKIKQGWIEDEDGETQTFNFILGLEE